MPVIEEINYRFDASKPYRPHLLLDSGAYTAWKSGGAIDLNRYADFLDHYKDRFAAFINLDEILSDDKEEAARRSRKNYLALRARGHVSVPVFHQGERIEHLYQMLDDGAPYICLAGASTLASAHKEQVWYDIVWNALVNKGAHPFVKVHGLGDTKRSSLFIYPWYSVDSSTWGRLAGLRAWAFVHVNGRPIKFSVRSDGKSQGGIRDIGTFHGEEKEALRALLAGYQLDLDEMLKRKPSNFTPRLLLAALHYKALMAEACNACHNTVPVIGLLATRARPDKPAIQPEPLKVYLASWMSQQFNGVLQIADYPYILLSFAHMIGGKMKYALQLMGEDFDASRKPKRVASAIQAAQPAKRGRRRLQDDANQPA